MISVPIDRIVPLTDARDNFSRLVSDIESAQEGMYVLTKGGKPTIALVNISYLEELIGRSNGVSDSHSTSFAPPKPAFKSNHQPSRPEPKPQEKAPIFNAPAPIHDGMRSQGNVAVVALPATIVASTPPATNTPPVNYEPKIAPAAAEPPKEIIEKPKVDPSGPGQDPVSPSFPFPSVPSSAPAAVPPPKAAAAWPLVPPKPAFAPTPTPPPMPPTIANSAPQPFTPPVNAPPVPPLPKPAFTTPPIPPLPTVPPALAPNTLSSSPNVTAPAFPKPPEAPSLPKPPLGPPPPNPLATPFTTDQPKPAPAVSTGSTITFDSPPKTIVEPGESLPPPPPPPPSVNVNKPFQAPPAPPTASSTPIQQPVKDLEI